MNPHNSEPIYIIPPDLVIGPSADALPLAGEVNWGIQTFGVYLLRRATDGAGVIVGVCDTGIDEGHPIISPNFKAAKDFTGSSSGHRDRNGHGTHCSGTVLGADPRIGMAPGAKLVHSKVLSDGGSGAGTWIARGIHWAVEQGAEIISMSLGSSGQDTNITRAMQQVSEQSNVWCICAAGNSGPNTPDVDWPGRSPWCISVAALNPDLSPASFTSAGAKIDTAYAGVNIWSARPGGGYQQMSGTSMATPGVAGIMALYRSALKKRGLIIPNVTDLRAMLRADSTDTYAPGVDRRTGPGWVTPILLALNLNPDPPPVS